MSARRAVLTPLHPLLVRRSPLCLFQQQPCRQAHQLGRLAHSRGLGAAPRRAPLLSPIVFRLNSRAYSSATSPYPQSPFQQPPPPPPPPRSRFRRVVSFLFRGVLYTTLGSGLVMLVTGIIMVRDIAGHDNVRAVIARSRGGGSPDDADAIIAHSTGEDAVQAAAIRDQILGHPLVAELEADPRLRAAHPHHKLPPIFRQHNLTAGTLIGPGLMAVPPFTWLDDHGESLVMILHAGRGLCGHPGIVHGGFVATVLDEGLTRCCFKAMPSKVAMTAYLRIDYRAPTPADGLVVLRAETTKVEGRKAWVKGRLETLPPAGSGEAPTVLAEAEGLFVSPKNAWVLSALAAAI